MFYVYDIEGLRFKGSLEELEAQRRVARRIAVTPLKEGGRSAPFPEEAGGQAFAAYRQMINRENLLEPLVHIYQIMSSPVSTVNRDTPLVDAWRMLKQGNVRQLVVTSERKQLVGLLSDRDILKRINVIEEEVQVDQEISVGEVIPAETITTASMSDIRRVARVMAYYHIDAMPVLEEERLVGIVTRGDILRGFAENPKLNLWA